MSKQYIISVGNISEWADFEDVTKLLYEKLDGIEDVEDECFYNNGRARVSVRTDNDFCYDDMETILDQNGYDCEFLTVYK